ncbi:hypothetical protein RI844_09770 [Thalassotalea fonticola]|uniref:Choice-of-anchor D domain-containing protein n=1 Tax=Thalassotalea fonticola TaxID=3065649 RepID=A0ABZ0GUL3_9GAMM|nr:hypothetical protein RI844_09770 [Colwelliaceae bacterium S1-1]
MKLIKTFTLLLAASAINVANAEITASNNTLVFSTNTGLSQQVSIKNRHSADATIVAGDFTITNQMGNAATTYTVDTSDCVGILPKTNSCSVIIDYLPSASFDSQLILFSDPLSSDVLPIYLSNYYKEASAEQASRRLSPVIENVVMLDDLGNPLANNQLFDHASEDQDYTVTWTVLTYEPLVAQAYLFDCDIASKDCAAKTAAAYGKIDNTPTITGVTLTPAEVAAAGYEDYSFNGQSAIHQTFTSTITIQPDDFNDVTPHSLALRFYHVTTTDSKRQFSTGVSTSLSGNLNFVGQGDTGYFDTVGRALVLTGNNGL